MKGIQKLLLVSILLPLSAAPLLAKDKDSDRSHDFIIVTGASLIGCGYLSYLAFKAAGTRFEELKERAMKKTTPDAKTEAGKELRKDTQKALKAFAGLTGAFLLARYIQDPVYKKFPVLDHVL